MTRLEPVFVKDLATEFDGANNEGLGRKMQLLDMVTAANLAGWIQIPAGAPRHTGCHAQSTFANIDNARGIDGPPTNWRRALDGVAVSLAH